MKDEKIFIDLVIVFILADGIFYINTQFGLSCSLITTLQLNHCLFKNSMIKFIFTLNM